MRLALRNILIVIALFCVCSVNVYAGKQGLAMRLLNVDAGAPMSPGNIKAVIQLPVELQARKITADNFRFYVYPKKLEPVKGAQERYRAGGVIFWQRGSLLFADIRNLPYQDSAGECSVLCAFMTGDKVATSALAAGSVVYESPDIDVALIIDCSQSMAKNDPHKKRLAAASAFIKVAARDGKINSVGLIKFNDTAKLIAPMLDIKNMANQEMLLEKLKTIGADGQTNIGLAFEEAVELFKSSHRRRRAVIFLTDGRNESVAYADQHLQLAVEETAVYCIGLSKEADMSMLERISNETGGRAYSAANYNELMSLYQRIAAEIGKRKVVLSKTIADEQTVITFPVDETVKNLNLAADAGPSDLTLELISPQGPVSTKSYNTADFQELKIDHPVVGVWTVKISKKKNVIASNVAISAETTLFVDTFPPLKSGENILLAATLADRKRIVAGNVAVLDGLGDKPVVLYDDGMHHDGEKGDGLYVAVLSENFADRRRVVLSAKELSGASFLRQTDAGYLAFDKAVYVESSTYVPDAVDLGSLFPGQMCTREFKIKHQGRDKTFTLACDKLKTVSGGLLKGSCEIAAEVKIVDGNNDLKIKCGLDGDAVPGKYSGIVQARSGDKKYEFPVLLQVMSYGLKVKDSKYDLGMVVPGDALDIEIPVYFESDKPLKAEVKSDAQWLNAITDSGALEPGLEQILSVKATVDSGVVPGLKKTSLFISLGAEKKRIELSFEIPQRGNVEQSLVNVHEFKLPKLGRAMVAGGYVHEMAVTPKVVAVAIAPVRSGQKSNDKLTGTISHVKPPVNGNAFFSPAVIMAMAVLIAITLLVIRSMLNNRLTRFTLLSLAIHIPLVAFVAGYLMLVNKPADRKVKNDVISVEIAHEKSSKQVESGDDTDSGILVKSIGVVENSESRFLSKGNSKRIVQEAQKQYSLKNDEDSIELNNQKESILADGVTRQISEKIVAVKRVPGAPELAVGRRELLSKPEVADENMSNNSEEIIVRENSQMDNVGRLNVSAIKVNNAQKSLTTVRVNSFILPTTELSEKSGMVNEQKKVEREVNHKLSLNQVTVPHNEEVVSAVSGSSASKVLETVDNMNNEQKFNNDKIDIKYKLARKIKAVVTAGNQLAAVETEALSLVAEDKSGSADSVTREFANKQIEKRKVPGRSVAIEKPEVIPAVKAQVAGGKDVSAEIIDAGEPALAPNRSVMAKNDGSILNGKLLYSREIVTGFPEKGKPVLLPVARSIAITEKNIAAPSVTADINVEKVSGNSRLAVTSSSVNSENEDRFGEGGFTLLAMSAPEGGTSRLERASISFSDSKPVVRSERKDRKGLAKSAEGSENIKDVFTANASKIDIRLGLFGEFDCLLPEYIANDVKLQAVKVGVNKNDFSNVQVLIVAGISDFNENEKALLDAYLKNGGKIWFYGKSIPDYLRNECEANSRDSGSLIKKNIYDLSSLALQTEGLARNGLSVVSTSRVSDKHLSQLSINVLNAFFDNKFSLIETAENKLNKTLWQDFDSLAAGRHGWRVESWSSPAAIGLAPDGKGGNSLVASVLNNTSGKVGVSYDIPEYNNRRIDLGGYTKACVDIFNTSENPVKASLLLTAYTPERGWDEFETKPVLLKNGWNRNTVFELSGLLSRLEGRKSYSSKLHGAEQCARVTVLLRTSGKVKVLVDNICWVK